MSTVSPRKKLDSCWKSVNFLKLKQEYLKMCPVHGQRIPIKSAIFQVKITMCHHKITMKKSCPEDIAAVSVSILDTLKKLVSICIIMCVCPFTSNDEIAVRKYPSTRFPMVRCWLFSQLDVFCLSTSQYIRWAFFGPQSSSGSHCSCRPRSGAAQF